jgi:hypothetical protein
MDGNITADVDGNSDYFVVGDLVIISVKEE